MKSNRAFFVVYFFLTMVCWGSCKQAHLRDGADLQSSIKRLSELVDEYYEIPVYRQNLGDRSFITWKDQTQLRSLYETNRNDIRIMDNAFSVNATIPGTWSDDAAFGRGVLYCLLTQLASQDPLTQESALAVWGDFIQLGPGVHIEEFTKNALDKAFVNKLDILTPSLSYEENLRVIFLAYTALSLIKLKEYQKAIKENELIIQKYPASKYAQAYAPNQIRNIKEVMEGKMAPPEGLPEQWQGHRLK